MNPQPNPRQSHIRDVVCMFCTWTWITGKPSGSAAKCPHCGYEGGVEEFMVMKPGVEGFVVVRPRYHHAF